jgi:DNA-binding GntR family transcriptional regulator
MALIFESLKRGPVKTRVADAVRNAIYAGKLRPGDPLLELQLAKDFEVSQTSVREALIHLEQLGLVRRVANKGTFVTELSPEQVRDRLEVRLKLEYMAAIRAVPRLTAIDVARLHELADLIAATTSRKEYFLAAQYDLEFHRTLWRLSNSETLYQVLDQIAAPLFAFISIVRSSSRAAPIVLHSHHDIVNALEGGDPNVIQSSLEYHFADSYDQFVTPQSARDAHS